MAPLHPAVVDPATGYRRYRPEQLLQGRLICALRRIDVPLDVVRVALDDADGESLRTVLQQHRQRLLDRAEILSRMVRVVNHYIEHGVAMPELKTPRIVHVTINVTDLAGAISFYQAAFDAVSSFQFGTWPSEEFFLLTVSHEANEHGKHDGPAGVSRFGLLVEDVDAAHRRADPSGNRIDLYQG